MFFFYFQFSEPPMPLMPGTKSPISTATYLPHNSSLNHLASRPSTASPPTQNKRTRPKSNIVISSNSNIASQVWLWVFVQRVPINSWQCACYDKCRGGKSLNNLTGQTVVKVSSWSKWDLRIRDRIFLGQTCFTNNLYIALVVSEFLCCHHLSLSRSHFVNNFWP